MLSLMLIGRVVQIRDVQPLAIACSWARISFLGVPRNNPLFLVLVLSLNTDP
jgi:hypothetical protein